MGIIVAFLRGLLGAIGGNRSPRRDRQTGGARPERRTPPAPPAPRAGDATNGPSLTSLRSGPPEPAGSAGGDAEPRPAKRTELEPESEMAPLTLSIGGLAGSPDRAGVLSAKLRQLRGVIRAYVSPFTALAYVDYCPSLVSEGELIGAITGAGFSAGAPERFAWRRV